jgi:hypothetical protein
MTVVLITGHGDTKDTEKDALNLRVLRLSVVRVE